MRERGCERERERERERELTPSVWTLPCPRSYYRSSKRFGLECLKCSRATVTPKAGAAGAPS